MSLYHVVHGVNPAAGLLLSILGIKLESVGRFRDCFLAKAEGGLEIHLYTRNGGGNRSHVEWDGGVEYRIEGEDCRCTGCVMRHVLPKHPLYLWDRDDEFDNTYATVAFRIPEQHLGPMTDMAAMMPELLPGTHQERMEAFIKKVQSGVKDEQTERVMASLGPVFEQLNETLNKEGG